MGEQLKNHESNNSHELEKSSAESSAAYAREKIRLNHEAAKAETPDVEKIKDTVEKSARTSEELKSHVTKHDKAPRDAKDYEYSTPLTVSRTLQAARKQLTPVSKQFSKVVHNRAVETASDVTGATIARPSGMLFGGMFSFIVTVVVLTICKYYGYEYNQFIGVVSFAGGFVLGLLIEMILRIFRKPSKI